MKSYKFIFSYKYFVEKAGTINGRNVFLSEAGPHEPFDGLRPVVLSCSASGKFVKMVSLCIK
ncbi:MAG: hypothetical protein DBY44_03235 [Veillonellaceae bacterium]|nr:MAG: hypothetical protein DBY44_03235 [Veillonellaceae bacterium]